MTLVGATGHQDIPRSARHLVRRGVRDVLHDVEPPIRIVTSLAAGADQLVATEAMQIGGLIEAIIPSQNYETTFPTSEARTKYRRLLSEARSVVTLSFPAPSEEAYWEAGKTVVNRCEILIAVWDGQPARGLGGTADVVRYARERGREVHIVWPAGVSRG